MRRFFLALLGLLFSAAFWGQEVVVFKDFRSLVVQSHRVQGEWTYLRVSGGELAILSKGILEIRQEPAESRPSVAPAPASTSVGPTFQHPPGPQAAPPAPPPSPSPFRPPAAGAQNRSANAEADDDEENGVEAEEEGDEETPTQPPPMSKKPMGVPIGTVVKPGALMPPQGVAPTK